MAESTRGENVADEELLEGQSVFKGPRKLLTFFREWRSGDAEQ